MSDFLQLKDEILDGEPKFNITDNADGTKNIELATEVIQEAENLNNNDLGKHLNPVLGYNIPNNVELTISENVGTSTTSFLPIFSNNNFETIIPYKKYSKTFISPNLQNNKVTISTNDNHSTSENFAIHKAFDNNQGGLTNFELNLYGEFIVELEEPIKLKKGFIQTSQARIKIYGSNDGETYTQIFDGGSSTYDLTFTITTPNFYKYYKFKTSASGNYTNVTEVRFMECDYYLYDINFTIYGLPNFVNNQRLLINTFNLISSSGNNYINGIKVDTILESNKYYELIFDETNNRFIAEEVRV